MKVTDEEVTDIKRHADSASPSKAGPICFHGSWHANKPMQNKTNTVSSTFKLDQGSARKDERVQEN